MAPSDGPGGDPAAGEGSTSVTRSSRSDHRMGPTMRDRLAAAPTAGECDADGGVEEEAVARRGCYPNLAPRRHTPAAPTAGEGGSRWLGKRVLEDTGGKGDGYRHPSPRRPPPFGEGTSAAGAEEAVLTSGCGFLIPTLEPHAARERPDANDGGPVASGGPGGGGGRGPRDYHHYNGTSGPRAPESDLAPKGNIAKWLKKEGDKVSCGKVLCEVEMDKATEDMQCTEEDYLAKIVQASVAKGGKCESSAASGLDCTDIPNAQIRKVSGGELNSLQEASGGKKISINDLVIKDAYKKVLGTIGEDVKQLAQRARDNSLKPQDYEGGTFTVSNLGGPFGIRQFSAIVNPPQSVILAIGSGGHDDKKVMIPTQHALSVNMDSNGENEISWEKEVSHPFSEVPDFVCSDSGRCFGKSNYMSKMNYYLRADFVSDINPISDKEVRSSNSRYEVLKAICCDLAVVPALLSTCASIKSSAVDTVTQIFVDICGLTISLQKNLSQLDIKKLTEAAFVRAGIKPSDFYSTFAGKVLEPNRLLSCYQIPRDSVIRLNARLRGGCAGDKTWDDVIRSQQRYVTVSLPPADLVPLRPDGSAQQGPVLVKYLAPLMQFRSRQVLIQLCRKHYSGTSYGGNITSKNILFDPDGNVRFNSAPEKFTQHSGKLDYKAIGKILDDSFKDTVSPIYPMHFYQLVYFLRYAPAVDCQCEAVIAFVTNHVSLRSHYVRVTISELLVQLVERLPADVLTALLAALDKIVWGNTVKKVAAMDHTYHYHSRTNQSGVWVPYVNHGVSYLKFSNNFFKHHNWASLEKLEAAFSLVMAHKNFIPRFLFTILVTLKHTQNQCPALIQSFIDQVVDMLGNNVIDLERG